MVLLGPLGLVRGPRLCVETRLPRQLPLVDVQIHQIHHPCVLEQEMILHIQGLQCVVDPGLEVLDLILSLNLMNPSRLGG